MRERSANGERRRFGASASSSQRTSWSWSLRWWLRLCVFGCHILLLTRKSMRFRFAMPRVRVCVRTNIVRPCRGTGLLRRQIDIIRHCKRGTGAAPFPKRGKTPPPRMCMCVCVVYLHMPKPRHKHKHRHTNTHTDVPKRKRRTRKRVRAYDGEINNSRRTKTHTHTTQARKSFAYARGVDTTGLKSDDRIQL